MQESNNPHIQAERAAYLSELNARQAVHRLAGSTAREAADRAFEETKELRQRLKQLMDESNYN